MKTAQDVVDLLNSAFKADPVAVASLVNQWAWANNALVDHPTIVTDNRRIGIVGLLNGLFRDSPTGDLIAAVYDNVPNYKLVGFKLVSRRTVEIPQDAAPSQG